MPAHPDPESLADVVEDLSAIFRARLPRPTVIAIVRRCRRELDIVHGASIPEMVERLAHQRLLNLIKEADRTRS